MALTIWLLLAVVVAVHPMALGLRAVAVLAVY
jgi:hypothetical protein